MLVSDTQTRVNILARSTTPDTVKEDMTQFRSLALLAIAALTTGHSCQTWPPTPPHPTTTSSPTSTSSPSPTSNPSPTPTSAQRISVAAGVELPDGAVGAQLRWVMQIINADTGPTAADATQHLAESFLQQVPIEQLVAVFEQVRSFAPLTITAITESTPTTMAATVEAKTPFHLRIGLQQDGKIEALLFAPKPPPHDPASSFDEAYADLNAVSTNNHVLAATVVDNRCQPQFERNSTQPAPMGSAFKLYVLAAVADAVERGDLAWDDELTITDEVKSLPSGVLQNAPSGTRITVRETAEKMISISDNTATDMLIDAVGVTAVETTIASIGVSDPDGLVPLATTKQFFQLGWGTNTDLRDKWTTATSAQRREILAALPAGVEGVTGVTTPQWPAGVDWFASAIDLCHVHVALQQRATKSFGEPIRAILSKNPGLPDAAANFRYTAFKGGSAPGAVTFSSYAERADGTPVVSVIQVAAREPFDEGTTYGPAADFLTLLSKRGDDG